MPFLISLVTLLIGTDAIGRMVFGVIDKTAGHPAWPFGLVLAGVMAIAAGGAVSNCWFLNGHLRKRGWEARAAGLPPSFSENSNAGGQLVSGVASGVLLGFSWVGRATSQDPRGALIGALLGGGLALVLGLRLATFRPRALVVNLLALVSAYHGAFWLGTLGATASFVGQWGLAGLTWSGCVLGLCISGCCLQRAWAIATGG